MNSAGLCHMCLDNYSRALHTKSNGTLTTTCSSLMHWWNTLIWVFWLIASCSFLRFWFWRRPLLRTDLESGSGALCLCQDNESRPGIFDCVGSYRWHSRFSSILMWSLSFCVAPSLPPLYPPTLSCSPAPGLRFGRECGWMHGRMVGSPCSLWLFSNLRTQLPGETTMTPPPHTQPAHRGPPVGDTLHRAATTAVSKVSTT